MLRLNYFVVENSELFELMLTNAMIYEYNLPKFYTIVTFIR